jgi:HemY protein
MRIALWLISLFSIAVAGALLAGSNAGTVTVFWPPYRVDLSLNLVLLALVLVFVVTHFAQRALSAMLALPQQAKRWRLLQKERAAYGALLDASANFIAGRFLRARKAAELVIEREKALAQAGGNGGALGHAPSLKALAHVMVAEAAHALQDKATRQTHLESALQEADLGPANVRQTIKEGSLLRAARWSLDDRDAQASLQWLDQLPLGVARRTVAMRLRLKASRLADQPAQALDTALLLAKHRAFSPAAADSIVRGLVVDLLAHTHETDQLQRVWQSLGSAQRLTPELAVHAAQRWLTLKGDVPVARSWLLPIWDRFLKSPSSLSSAQKIQLVRVLAQSLGQADAPAEREWLARIETAQLAQPQDAALLYLAGMACLKRQLWGKAQALLSQAVKHLSDADLRRQAWGALAQLAEQREDAVTAAAAWKRAATA